MKRSIAFALLLACEAHEPPVTTVTVEPPQAAKPAAAPSAPALAIAPDLHDRMARFTRMEIGVDEAKLDARGKKMVKKLIEAAQEMQKAFLLQVDPGNLELRTRLSGDALSYFDFMGGPWDRTDPRQRPFIGTREKPPQGGFYPQDLTKADVEAWIAAHPKDKEAFQSYFTVIRRQGADLVAVPYSEAYKDQLVPAAARLREAAALAEDPRLKNFLEKRAAAFQSNDYLDSDIAWMDLGDEPFEVTIGPYEVYDDELMGWKASFEAFIGMRDADESARLARVNQSLPQLDKNLPLDAKYRAHSVRGGASPISVVQVFYSAGQPGIHPVAYNLPNDERVRKAKGSKKVMLKNISEAKFKNVTVPIVERALTATQVPDVTFDAFFTFVLMHEMCHGLGPATVGGKEEVSKALEEMYGPVEEAKADVCGVISTQWLIDHKVFPKTLEKQIYASHLASAFRAVRFGATEAHARGELASFNYVVGQGGFVYDAKAGRFAVDYAKVKAAERALAHEWLTIEAKGDRAGAKAFLDKWAVMKPEMEAIVKTLADIPVDIRADFTVLARLPGW